MAITIKTLEENIKTLSEDLYGELNDFVDFLKFKYSPEYSQSIIPEWQIEETNKRLRYISGKPSKHRFRIRNE